MITIEVTEDTYTLEDMATVLRRIADLLDEGYTSGFGPDWDTKGEEEGNCRFEFLEDDEWRCEIHDVIMTQKTKPTCCTIRREQLDGAIMPENSGGKP